MATTLFISYGETKNMYSTSARNHLLNYNEHRFNTCTCIMITKRTKNELQEMRNIYVAGFGKINAGRVNLMFVSVDIISYL